MKTIILLFALLFVQRWNAQTKDDSKKEEVQIFVPKTIGQDDKSKEILYISPASGLISLSFMLYDRWGEKLCRYETKQEKYVLNDFNKFSAGAYVWTLQCRVLQGKDTIEKRMSGSVTFLK